VVYVQEGNFPGVDGRQRPGRKARKTHLENFIPRKKTSSNIESNFLIIQFHSQFRNGSFDPNLAAEPLGHGHSPYRSRQPAPPACEHAAGANRLNRHGSKLT